MSHWTDEDILSNIEEFTSILDEHEIPHLIKNLIKDGGKNEKKSETN